MSLRASLTRHNTRQISVIFATAVCLAMPATSAIAQSNEQAKGRFIETIIVTATKRATTLQDTPFSISALNEKGLEQRGVDDLLDFVGSVPGLVLRDNGPGQTRPIIRGLNSVGESQVGVYFDETPMTSAPGTTNDAGRFSPEIKPFDFARIEVLKGPQGTLYGGGSMSGAIRFILNKPDATKFAAKISGEGSLVNQGGEGYQINGMVNIPLIEDTLALRAVGYRRYDSGFIDNVILNKDDINDIDTVGGRIAVRWTPIDSLTLTATAHVQDQDVGGGFHFIASNADRGTINGTPSPLSNGSNLKSDPKTDIGAEEPFTDKLELYNVTVENDFGWANLLYSFSYFKREAEFRFYADQDGALDLTPPYDFVQPLLALQPLEPESTTHELRLTSAGSNRLDWTVGFFSQKREADSIGAVSVLNADGSLPAGLTRDIVENPTQGERYLLDRTISSLLEQQAVYGELTAHITDRFALTGGVRIFDIKNGSDVLRRVDISGDKGGFLCPRPGEDPKAADSVKCTTSTKGKGDGKTFRLHLSYQVSDDVLLYGQFAQGYRAGGANINSSVVNIGSSQEMQLDAVPESYKEDTVDSYELGIRSTWFNQRLTVNAAVYTMQWDDIQLPARDAKGRFSFIVSGDGAKIRGLEVELDAHIASYLTIQAGVSYTKAELDGDAPFNRGGNLAFGGTDATPGDGMNVRHSSSGKDGDPIPSVPELTFNIAVELSRHFSSGLRGTIFADYVYTGDSASDFNPFLIAPRGTEGAALDQVGDVSGYRNGKYSNNQGGYGIFDLRFGVESETKGWSAFVFVENVFDKRGITQVFVDGQFYQAPGYSFTERPRTVGFTLSQAF